jgi:hypothetical protein
MRMRVLSVLMRPMLPPLASWIVVAVALIVAETVVVYPLRVPADLPPTMERRARERVLASVRALLRAAREREGMGSAVER